jgi:Protein of unknown function (DUF2934)
MGSSQKYGQYAQQCAPWAPAKEESGMSNEQMKPLAESELDERIREKAYQLWKEDGSPEGRADVYWHRAREILDREANEHAGNA